MKLVVQTWREYTSQCNPLNVIKRIPNTLLDMIGSYEDSLFTLHDILFLDCSSVDICSDFFKNHSEEDDIFMCPEDTIDRLIYHNHLLDWESLVYEFWEGVKPIDLSEGFNGKIFIIPKYYYNNCDRP